MSRLPLELAGEALTPTLSRTREREKRPRIAVAALSARSLAEAARDAGFDAIALDVFGDRDTLAASVRWQRIGSGLRVEAAALCEALRGIDAQGWIAGAGCEPHLAAACAAAPSLPLIGNAPEVVAAVRDPAAFLGALDALGIAHPQTRDQAPAGDGAWLWKDAAGSGGWHVRQAVDAAMPPGHYAQRVHAGEPVSALFIADGRDAIVVGVQRQIVAPLAGRPYVFRGVIGPLSLGAGADARLAEIVAALVRRFGLRGLGSVDALLDGESLSVLEVNPRPTASLALYDGGALLAAHVAACRGGVLPASMRHAAGVRGTEIVFAPRDVVVGALPPWCHDVPAAGARIARHDPLCTVSAAGSTEAEVRTLLTQRRESVLSSLENA